MKFIKSHKTLVLVVAIFIVLTIVGIILFVSLSSSKDENAKYGSRLDGIEKVEITDSRLQSVKEKLLNINVVNSTSYNITGRIIKIFIEVHDETDELSVESLLNVILENFTEAEKAFYDFEVFVTNQNNVELYPMIAYKHWKNAKFTISKKVGMKNEE